ncbi:polyketide synthase [Dictyobacter alpinus]|uniref:Phenolphthiocerol/phthiocerol polyketide synthase subunit E n=1 Tax=Dictyobacter alpinus TaxID=2014873 RepID=A0A402BIR3_9CHLR|nr:type I polyketide synthase [Dictyobacter alpinus]GCE31288.1 polyketide synthase [Dictyobacter alpinus]
MTSSSEQDAYSTAIAIVGMSGRFPGARDTSTFWENLMGGVKSIRRFSDEELLAAGVDPEQLLAPDYVKAGAILDDVEKFDAAFFGFSPRDAEIMDPQHRFFLECAWEALEDAAYDPATYPGLISVFAGSGFSTYLINNLYQNPALADIADPLLSAIGNERDSLASMVSYKMNLKGPSFSVHTFCSTSLVAVHLACQSLLNYESDLALAGGVAIHVPHLAGYTYKEGGIVSPDGECRTFDASARGSVVGNGIGVVTLKRLSEAIEDRDHIYAVIRGSAANNDGSQRVSYTAPGLNGQSEVIAEAIGNAGVDIESISYLEAHGTGTRLGDAVELAAMKKAFAASTDKTGFCAIGSVKPNVGHLDRASGVTGLIKTTLALQHKRLPPTINFEHTSADIDLEHSPFYVLTQAREWISPTDEPLRAGVSSFGLGGTNVHMVLEEAPVREVHGETRPWQLLLLSAKTEQALDAATLKLATYLQRDDVDLSDVAYTLQVGRSTFNYRRMLVCKDKQEALRNLQIPAQDPLMSKHQTTHDSTVAFLFPGLGEHYSGMAQDLYQQEPVFRETVTSCCTWLEQHLQINVLEYLYPAQGRGRRKTVHGHAAGDVAMPSTIELADLALFIIEYALARLLMSWGIQPAALCGYSQGEYVASCLAGIFSLEDALWLVAQRARLIATQSSGAILAVALAADTVQSYLDEELSLAAINGPKLCLLSGSIQAIEDIEERFAQQEVECQRLDVAYALHSTQLAHLQAQLTALVGSRQLHAPQIPLLSNLTGDWMTAEQATDPAYWAQHMSQTIQFAVGVERLIHETKHILLEVGPGQALSAILSQHPDNHDTGRIISTLPAANQPRFASAHVLKALGQLWLEDVVPAWSQFYEHEQRQRISLPTYPFERQTYWVDPPQRQLTIQPTGSVSQKQSASATGKKVDPADWFYRLHWEETPSLSLPTAGKQSGPWLVFDDLTSIGDAIIQRLQQAKIEVIRVQADSSFACLDSHRFHIRADVQDDYVALGKALEQLPPISTVLHLWTTQAEQATASDAATFQFWQDRGLYSLLFLTKALGAQLYDTPITILVASTGLHEITGRELLTPEKETLMGACKVISQEYLNITCRCIDFEQWSDQESTWLAETLLAEHGTDNSDYVVAYRQGMRHRQAFEPAPLSLPPAHSARNVFRRHGVYLITGGLGGVGLVLASYLAREVQARLILVGRADFPARETWSDWLLTHDEHDSTRQRIEQLQTIEALGGQLMIAQADVADRQQLEAVFEQADRQFGRIHGVIHAAGTSARSAFGTIQELEREQCEQHFQPKVYGLYALEQVIGERDLDFCLLFSSLASILGGLGFAGYTAANIFMDAFVRKHNREAATLWTSINWDTWSLKADAHGALGATVAEFAMSPEEGAQALLHILAYRNITYLINSTGDLPARIRQWIKFEGEKQAEPAVNERRDVPRPYMSTDYVAPSDGYEQLVIDAWQQILGINHIGVQDNFFELGGHSLMGTQLISRLRKTFQMEIPLSTLFDAPTVAELTGIIKNMVIEEAEKQSTKEAVTN